MHQKIILLLKLNNKKKKLFNGRSCWN